MEDSTMTDVIIVGAGCAGLTAAVYAIRAGLSVLVFEKYMYGGQISVSSEVENYPSIEKISGPDLSNNIYQQAINQGADIRFEEVLSVQLDGTEKTVTTAENTYAAKAVIIANGVQRRTLGCAGEEEFTGRGVSYCATCDGAFFRGKTVAVVGGGNTALEDALFLSNLCEKVYIIHRSEALRGEKVMRDAVLSRANITVLYDTTVQEIRGESKVSSVHVQNSQTDESSVLPVDAVFIAIGLAPDNQIFSALALDSAGYLVADENCTTAIPGVYVAGDNRTKLLRQIITAAADGAVAAFQAANYINVLSD
ncbi:thioredoxin-disulfide reductase [Hydrogenoanaerobacterium sp.]|uniref:thioredoxin-disulfide reductase n=1 Tax=Hydrogenoanaerobacterium sp. TaxID=2953763 RepID=UPI0028A1455A|nr:thioredoxin-disulfide reductase [Hydrogenoanaerobacterium sp.]